MLPVQFSEGPGVLRAERPVRQHADHRPQRLHCRSQLIRDAAQCTGPRVGRRLRRRSKGPEALQGLR